MSTPEFNSIEALDTIVQAGYNVAVYYELKPHKSEGWYVEVQHQGLSPDTGIYGYSPVALDKAIERVYRMVFP